MKFHMPVIAIKGHVVISLSKCSLKRVAVFILPSHQISGH